jgi:heme/copper-type cytochrome/quinol oxidase subunit 2
MRESKSFRCLDVDNSIILKVLEPIRFMISSADVIHSFSLPKFGLKVDAVPGRIKESFSFPLYLGKFFGQCSEICGAKHSFMPISVEVILK